MRETRKQGGKGGRAEDTLDGLQMPSGKTPVPGMVVAGKFALKREIASGGMGIVFEGRDLFIDRPVAIKLMHAELTEDPVLVARFRREARAAARIQHPNVVTVHEVGKRRDGTYYIVHELLAGQTLRDVLDERCGRLDASEVFSIAIPVMGGLVAAHIQTIVHRDIKPENIILAETPSGEVVPKVIDFGIAKLRGGERITESLPLAQSLTTVGSVMGTPEYMAPEQVRGEKVDARADIWAMGVVLFEMLSGKLPFSGGPYELLAQILDRPIPRLEDRLPESLWPVARVVQRALERDLDKRIPTMADFRDELIAAYPRGGAEPVAMVAPIRLGRASVVAEVPAMAAATEPAWRVLEDDGDSLKNSARSSGQPSGPAEPGAPSIRIDVSYDPIEMAEHALSVNSLHEAIGWAELALPSGTIGEEARGRAFMVLAVAHLWLGDHADAARAAQGALARLTRGTSEWHAAFDHLVTAYGYLGRTERLLALVDELRRAEEEGDEDVKSEAHIVTLCRLSVFVRRAGVPALAERLLVDAKVAAKALKSLGNLALGWLDVARAEAALHGGHLASFVRSVELAIEHFTSAGDIRSACLERSNVGHAYLQIGAWERASSALRETLSIAEPMQLEFAATARAKLGFAVAQAGRLEEGIAVISEALGASVKQGNRRAESLSRVYLARLLLRKGEPSAAEMAKKAVDAADGQPGRRALALATQANILFALELPAEASALAQEAKRILDKLGGVEEGEPLIRYIHIEALRTEGKVEEARRAALEAKRLLLEKADRIGDPDIRRSFLERVPDNTRIVSLA